MNCPVCNNIKLVMSERSGIEIDYCPQCRGVWLDRGELDKIIERATAEQRPLAPPLPDYRQKDYTDGRHRDKHYESHSGGYYHKKKSFLSEIFD